MKDLLDRPRLGDAFNNTDLRILDEVKVRRLIQPYIQHFEHILSQHIEHLSQVKAVNEPEYIGIPVRNKLELVRIKDIIRLESNRSYTHFYLVNGEEKLSCKSLSAYQEILGNDFFKVHRSHLVRLDKIKYLHDKKDGSVTLCNDHSVPVSRDHLPNLKRRLNFIQ